MTGPRIVMFDLETLPDLREVLKIYPSLSDYPGKTLKAQITSIISFGYKEFGKNNPTKILSAWNFPERWAKDVNDDYEVVKFAYDTLIGADAVMTFNGKRFDWKVLQTRLAKHRLPFLPKTIPHIDLYDIVRSNFSLYRNSLNNAADFLINEQKKKNEGWGLWEKVHRRDKKACELMDRYCLRDTLLLEKIFKPLRPLIKNIPNHNLWMPGDTKACPSCGSTRLKGNGLRATTGRIYRRYNCLDCGAWPRTDLADRNPR